MGDAKREAFEVALRRTLGFHLGTEDGAGHDAQDRELLVSALLDAAEEGTLRDGAAVGREFEDYLPDVAAAAKSGSLPSSSSTEQQEEVELYEDIVRWAGEDQMTLGISVRPPACAPFQPQQHFYNCAPFIYRPVDGSKYFVSIGTFVDVLLSF